jgi:hypothetical protein
LFSARSRNNELLAGLRGLAAHGLTNVLDVLQRLTLVTLLEVPLRLEDLSDRGLGVFCESDL